MTAVNPPPIKIPDLKDKVLQTYLKQFKDAFYLLWFQVGAGTGIIPVVGGGTGADTASDARTNLGLGTIATQNANNVTVTGGSVTGITDLAVADGGTGASNASDARTNLGLGTIATQAANNVAITGGTINTATVGASTPAAGTFTTLRANTDFQTDKTITAAATVGAQTINKPAGSVNFAAAASSLVVTNSLVTTSSVILATVATNDSTMKSVLCVAASGSFTIHANAAATAETRVNFLVVN